MLALKSRTHCGATPRSDAKADIATVHPTYGFPTLLFGVWAVRTQSLVLLFSLCLQKNMSHSFSSHSAPSIRNAQLEERAGASSLGAVCFSRTIGKSRTRWPLSVKEIIAPSSKSYNESSKTHCRRLIKWPVRLFRSRKTTASQSAFQTRAGFQQSLNHEQG